MNILNSISRINQMPPMVRISLLAVFIIPIVGCGGQTDAPKVEENKVEQATRSAKKGKSKNSTKSVAERLAEQTKAQNDRKHAPLPRPAGGYGRK